jgi:hypothetical protein
MNRDVDAYVSKNVLPQYQPLVQRFRELMAKSFPTVTETMRNGTPAYPGTPAYRLKRLIIVISPAKDYVTFAFARGASFKDAYGLLEGVGKTAKNVRLSRVEDFNEDAFRYYISQAVELDT